jgi:hypothetical protein
VKKHFRITPANALLTTDPTLERPMAVATTSLSMACTLTSSSISPKVEQKGRSESP